MPSEERVFSPQASNEEERQWDGTLRPQTFDEFIGQKALKENLAIYVESARRRKEAMDHLLFSGPPGLGKTTLAFIIAKLMGSNIHVTTGPILSKPADLAGILSHLEKGDVLFIDEIHRLPGIVEEYLYSAMEDFVLDIKLEQGPYAKSVRVNLPRFTLVGATTREGLLSSPFRGRFMVREKLNYYPADEIAAVIRRSAGILKMSIREEAAAMIAGRSRGTPRIANRFLRRIRDVAVVRSKQEIDEEVAGEGLRRLGVDDHGLEEMDRRILKAIMEFGVSAVGIKTVALAVGEEEDTVEEYYEPFLIEQGLLMKTPRGRSVTDKALRLYGHLAPRSTANMTKMASKQQNLFPEGG